MKIYRTKLGETWDEIAHCEMGSSKYLSMLEKANRQEIETYIFSAGTELVIPEVAKESKLKMPLWRQR